MFPFKKHRFELYFCVMTQICAEKIAMLCHYGHFFACFVPPAKIRLCLQTAKRFLDCFRGLLEVLGREKRLK